ncbi:DIL domain-containing protein [Pilobolus umbonatus]|nr:DIL domain-containing protein [Pilobolus umbonatus]
MDASLTLKQPKPTIASRRPMLSSQRSHSALSINTKSSQDLMRRNSSSSALGRHRRHTPTHVPPLPLSAHQNNMSPEELSAKIANSFQEFSSMLTQLSKISTPSPSITSFVPNNTTKNYFNSFPLSPPTSSASGSHEIGVQSPQNKQMESIACHPTSHPVMTPPMSNEESEDESEDDDTVKTHAIYHENALQRIDQGNTKLRRRLVSLWLARAASIGEIETIRSILNEVGSCKDGDKIFCINRPSDKSTGLTALMYASYFGALDCVNLILEQQSIQVNQQDKKGWTALMWAINGKQTEVAKLLLGHKAETQLKTSLGRTLYHYPIPPEINLLLDQPKITKKTKKKSDKSRRAISVLINTKEIDIYNQAPLDGYSYFINNTHKEDTKRRSSADIKTTKSTSADLRHSVDFHLSESSEDEEEDIKEWHSRIKSAQTFIWDDCLPDQMLVFSPDDLQLIVDQALIAVDPKTAMNKNQLSNEIWAPANIILLTARFAHYFSYREVLSRVMEAVCTKMSRLLQTITRDIQSLAFWIANLCQLLTYLKKDTGLLTSTKEAQIKISELISEAYTYFITESQKKIEKILEPSMIDYEPISELEQVDFVNDWQKFFRRNKTRKLSEDRSVADINKMNSSTTHASSNIDLILASTEFSPYSMTALLTNIQSLLQSYHVPPAIVIQSMAQFFHYISCESFNRVLSNKKNLCRSRALQIRMNISVMEEWVKMSKLPSSLINAFEPLTQLLQLLQCLSQMNDCVTFSSTVQTFEKLNPLQIKRCVHNYRYEVSEPRLPEKVEQMASHMVAEFTLKRQTSGGSLNAIYNNKIAMSRNSADTVRSLSERSRPTSVSSLNSLITPPKERMSLDETDVFSLDDLDDEILNDMKHTEKRNSKYLLPFSIPTTTALLKGWTEEQHKVHKKAAADEDIILYSEAIYQEIKHKKQEEHNDDHLDKVMPSIPEDWLLRLDKRLTVR